MSPRRVGAYGSRGTPPGAARFVVYAHALRRLPIGPPSVSRRANGVKGEAPLNIMSIVLFFGSHNVLTDSYTVNYIMSMTWLRRVFQYVFVPLSIPLIRAEVKQLRRDIWRIDQKVNRHLRADSPTDGAPSRRNPGLVIAYPYLSKFENPWVEANGAEQPEHTGEDMGVVETPGP